MLHIALGGATVPPRVGGSYLRRDPKYRSFSQKRFSIFPKIPSNFLSTWFLASDCLPHSIGLGGIPLGINEASEPVTPDEQTGLRRVREEVKAKLTEVLTADRLHLPYELKPLSFHKEHLLRKTSPSGRALHARKRHGPLGVGDPLQSASQSNHRH